MGVARSSSQGVAIMAMTYNAQNAPFGAISTYRVTSALYGVADDVHAWNARRTMAAEFHSLTPSELEDIGLTAASKDARQRGIFGRFTGWVKGKFDAYRTAQELARLNPKLLDDIGLTQADIERVRDRAAIF